MIDRERHGGPIIVRCDDCDDICETHCTDFTSALAKAKSRGFVVRKHGDEWQHFCRDCA